jgi:hypothetical protein
MFIEGKEQQDEAQKNLKRKRVGSLASVFSRALSVLTGRKITVNVVDEPRQHAPAWSSTHEVWLNLAEIKDDFTARSIASHNGLSFHELGHLRYTPRNGSPLIGLIKADSDSQKLWSAFNCLEDSRIENLLIAYLPSIKSWLTATITDYLLDNPETINRMFPLVYGRYYLPQEVRQLASDTYLKRDDLPELVSIIDEYTAILHSPDNAETTFALIKKFADLLDNLPPMPKDPSGNDEGDGEGEGGCVIVVRVPNPNGHDNRPTQGYESSSNRPASRKEQERELEKVLKGRTPIVIDLTKEDTEDSFGDVDDDVDSQPKQSQPKQSQPKEDSDSDFGDDDFDFDDDDFDTENDSDSQPNKPSQSKNAGDEAGDTGENTQVTDVLNDIMKDVVDNLSKEINDIAKQLGITDLDGGNAKEPQKARYNNVNAPIELVDVSRAFGRELERLRAEHDPQWIRYRDTGKVNAHRYLRGDDFDSIFDEYSEGRDDVTEIEAVILLDKSGSMEGSNANNAYKSMWAIKNALERVNARTTVVLFDYNTYLLYGADEKAGTTIRDSGASGGTNPEEALLYAKRVLAETEKPIRILFMITDGVWDTDLGEQAVIEMRNAGVLTCQALISDIDVSSLGNARVDYLNSYRHSFELLSVIRTAKDILTLGKELVRLAIKRNLVVNA